MSSPAYSYFANLVFYLVQGTIVFFSGRIVKLKDVGECFIARYSEDIKCHQKETYYSLFAVSCVNLESSSQIIQSPSKLLNNPHTSLNER